MRPTAPLLALLGGLSLLAGCSLQPRPAMHYRMDAEGGLWNHGLHLHPAGTRPLDFTTAFVRIDPQGLSYGPNYIQPLTFLVVAVNPSAETLTVDPARFRARAGYRPDARPAPEAPRSPPGGLMGPVYTASAPRPGPPPKPPDSVLTALDPELVLRDADHRMAAEQSRYLSGQMVHGLYLLTGTVLGAAAVLSGEKETQAQRAERKAVEKEIEEGQAADEVRHREAMAREAALRDTWSSRMLRKSTLLPGMKVSGLVVFASREFRDLPDTLSLRYLAPDHPPAELGSYTLGLDSIPRL